jgi:hypothetical protein
MCMITQEVLLNETVNYAQVATLKLGPCLQWKYSLLLAKERGFTSTLCTPSVEDGLARSSMPTCPPSRCSHSTSARASSTSSLRQEPAATYN